MDKRFSFRRVIAVAVVLGVLVPMAVLARTLILGRLFGSPLDLLLFPGSIFLFHASSRSAVYGLAAFGLGLAVTVALYGFAAVILFAIFHGLTGVWRFLRRR